MQQATLADPLLRLDHPVIWLQLKLAGQAHFLTILLGSGCRTTPHSTRPVWCSLLADCPSSLAHGVVFWPLECS